jgi:hypothetical protein
MDRLLNLFLVDWLKSYKINLCLSASLMKKELQELINEAKLKFKTSENITILRNHLNESYQEHEFLNMKNSFNRLVNNL